mmetsp:Transcript_42395/g.126858  ORF Transcript_42395/g.126858 Transcript_42395/m.126858 type:complete len:111 (-) Transcript_42395:376-708(-)
MMGEEGDGNPAVRGRGTESMPASSAAITGEEGAGPGASGCGIEASFTKVGSAAAESAPSDARASASSTAGAEAADRTVVGEPSRSFELANLLRSVKLICRPPSDLLENVA